jgi:hypothetical protein
MSRNGRCWRLWSGAALVGLLLLGPAAMTCVMPRDLNKQVELAGDEVVLGTVIDLQEVDAIDLDGHTARWTLVEFQVEESLATARKDFRLRFFFRGGVLPGSPSTSITPSPEQMQIGKRLLLFLGDREFSEQIHGERILMLDSYAESYSVVRYNNRSSLQHIVIGKGNGFAFENNTSLDAARVGVQQALTALRNKQKVK